MKKLNKWILRGFATVIVGFLLSAILILMGLGATIFFVKGLEFFEYVM
jgi:uncharacterized membrane protein